MASSETPHRGKSRAKGLPMSPLEKRAVSGLSFIYVARMLGLYRLPTQRTHKGGTANSRSAYFFV
ncbi:hypothetical protein [Acidithiobacillus ferrivorans]|uniref:hypothetical protein n=1 Tax=Acidithiobacillus ferrivorans TaxID=160808 RepID=UPI001C065899|nr:hypothetical protein [Acidithiobacillus ferrivorans]MBU2849599.1 hypothetical protein [Acidithiobacillus ferrivorans]